MILPTSRGEMRGLVLGVTSSNQTPSRGDTGKQDSNIRQRAIGEKFFCGHTHRGEDSHDSEDCRFVVSHLLDVGLANGMETVSEFLVKSQPKRTSERLAQPVRASATSERKILFIMPRSFFPRWHVANDRDERGDTTGQPHPHAEHTKNHLYVSQKRYEHTAKRRHHASEAFYQWSKSMLIVDHRLLFVFTLGLSQYTASRLYYLHYMLCSM